MEHNKRDELLKEDLGDLYDAYMVNLDGRRSIYPMDPVRWASELLGWDARWYQAKFLRTTAPNVALRWGRRAGKTVTLAVKALDIAVHQVRSYHRDPGTVMIVTPYEAQLDAFFNYLRGFLAKLSDVQVIRDKTYPQGISLSNGSRLIGATARVQTGARSEAIRGQDVDYLIIDEGDYIRDTDMDTMLAIVASQPDCGVSVSGTPSGVDTTFKKLCEDKSLGFEEFWVASHESPTYTEETDHFFKTMFDERQFKHEILACF